MAETAVALAGALADEGLAVFTAGNVATTSHQFAPKAGRHGGGQTAAKRLRQANIFTCGPPIDPVDGDLNGLRFGAPEIVRWGMEPEHMRDLARLIARVLIDGEDPGSVAPDTTEFRNRFRSMRKSG